MPPNSLSNIRVDIYSALAPNQLYAYAYTSNQGDFQFDDLPVGDYLVRIAVPHPYVYDQGNPANAITDETESLQDGTGDIMNYVKADETVYVSGVRVNADSTSSVSVALVAGYIVSLYATRKSSNTYEIRMISQSGKAIEDFTFSCSARVKIGDVFKAYADLLEFTIAAGDTQSQLLTIVTNANEDIGPGFLDIQIISFSHFRLLLAPDSYQVPIN